MEKLIVQQGEDTPSITFDKENSVFEISGKSFPDNVIEFYEPVLGWLKMYSESPLSKTEVTINLDYFNTSSAKIILDILQILSAMHKKGLDVKVKWLFSEDDEDLEQAGLRYSKVANIPIEVVVK